VPSHADPGLLEELDRRAAVLDRIFDMSRLAGSGSTPAKVRRYYEDSRLGYRLVHSRDGAMHMALNPAGAFDRAGYAGQARLVEDRFQAGTADVLELACGNGYNLELLAARHADKRFLGIDLVARQLARCDDRLAAHANARAVAGDFQALDLPDAAFDCVYVVESLCHATDLPAAFAEIRRVLRPGGRFVVIDAWRTAGFDDLPPAVRAAAAHVELAMAVADGQRLPAWKDAARDAGLRVTEELDLTAQIVPNLERLARIAETGLLSHPLRARLLKLVVRRPLLMNAVAGYLSPLTIAAGAHTYRLLTLEPAR
jgi:SAM-dependent methyltransferase